MMEEDKLKIPVEMLADIIKVFLAGLKRDTMEPGSDLICSMYPWTTNAYTTWTDVMSLRNILALNLEHSKNEECIQLAKALRVIWKVCKEKDQSWP